MEERKLFKTADNEYKEFTLSELISNYTPLVKKICYGYKSPTNEYEDMIQEANITIMDVFNNYDVKQNVSIGYYLTICITNSISSYCKTNKYKSIVGEKNKYLSLDTLINASDDGKDDWYSNTPDAKSTKEFESIENEILLSQLMVSLTDMEQTILKDSYLKGIPQEVIAKKYNYSQAQISRIKSTSLLKLRKYSSKYIT